MAAISLYELSDMVFCLPAEQDVCRCIIFEILHSMFLFAVSIEKGCNPDMAHMEHCLHPDAQHPRKWYWKWQP